MKRILLIFASIAAFFCSHAQGHKFAWAKNLAGTGSNNSALALATDSLGNVYSVGYFTAIIDFDPGSAVYNLTSKGIFDIFISKLDSNGNFIWAKQIGSTKDDRSFMIKLDNANHLYVCGNFQSKVDFDPGSGVSELNAAISAFDGFVLKMDTDGNFIWAKSLAGTKTTKPNDLLITKSGDVFVGGQFSGTTDFDPGTATDLKTVSGWPTGTEGFLVKLDSAGNYLWGRQIGGESGDGVNSMAMDDASNIYLGGHFSKMVDFDPGPAVVALTAAYTNGFVLKLDPSGKFIWVKPFESTKDSRVWGIATDHHGDVVAVGALQGTADFDPGTGNYTLAANGLMDGYLAKLDSSGNFIWAKLTGGSGHDIVFCVTTDEADNIYASGTFQLSVDFDSDTGVSMLTNPGTVSNGYILKLDPAAKCSWVKQLKSIGYAAGYDLVTDMHGNLYAGGMLTDTCYLDRDVDTLRLIIPVSDVLIHKWHGCAVNRNITVSDTMLSANATGSGITYQWLHCPSYTVIPGANSKDYTPAVSGSYALMISNGGCADTSDCAAITVTVGIEETFDNSQVSMVPNPTSGKLLISSTEAFRNTGIMIVNLVGQTLLEQKISGIEAGFDLSPYPAGIYLVKISTEGKGSVTRKVVKY